jgi:hypothetical protein
MKFLALISFWLFSISLSAQDTFIKIFDLDAPGSAFYNSTLVDDTLVLTGTVKNPDFFQWGTSWTQLDTFGNILSHKVHFDTLEDSYLFSDEFEMIHTSDEGYTLVGSLFYRDFGFLLKLDREGCFEFFQEYPDSDAANYIFQKVLEIGDGYIVNGMKQRPSDNYKRDAFIMKTDSNGNKLWEIIYGEYDLYDNFPSIHKLENDELLLIGYTYTGATTSSSSEVPFIGEATSKHKFLRINTEGEILEEWESDDYLILDSEDSRVQSQMLFDE